MAGSADVEAAVEYEMHMLQDGAWQPAIEAAAPDSLLKAAERVLALRGVDGVRVVRASRFGEYDHVERVILVKWVSPGVTDPDGIGTPMLGARTVCLQTADFYREAARDEIRVLLARFLEPRRLTPLELLHSVRHTDELANGKGMVEGAIQRVSLAQVQGTGVNSKTRYLDLINAAHKAINQLHADHEKWPIPHLEAGNFLAVAWEIESRFPDLDQFSYHCLRSLTRYLFGASSWTEKLARIGLLVQGGLEARQFKLLDMLVAEIFDAPPTLREMCGGPAKLELLANLVAELHAGRYRPADTPLAPGLSALNGVLKAGLLPRSRSALRRRLLVELAGRSVLRPDGDIFEELGALNTLSHNLAHVSPQLGSDEEVRATFEQRVAIVLSSDKLTAAVEGARSQADRIDRLSRLIALSVGEPNKAKLRDQLAATLSAGPPLRDAESNRGSRVEMLDTLLSTQMAILSSGLDPAVTAPAVTDLDAMVLEILRSDVMGVKKPLQDRIGLLLKVCGRYRMPEGKARSFVADSIGRAMKNPDFLPAYLKRFATETERRQAVMRLQSMLWAMGGPQTVV